MSFVGVDWSVEAFRAFRLDAAGRVIDRRESRGGLRRAARRGFEKTLFRHVGAWLDAGSTIVLATALAERRGWEETPFVAAPADLERLLGALVRRRVRDTTLLFLPGLANRAAHATDVMRREALLAFGAVAGGDGQRLLVVPGARSRWIRVVGGRVAAFRTTPSGELLTLLLERSFETSPSDETHGDDGAFVDGVERGYHSRHPVADLFAERAAVLLEERAPETARARLSGLMIGNEIREMEAALEATGEALTVLGTEAIRAPYARALRHLGTTVALETAEAAAVAGFAAVQRLLAGAAARETAAGSGVGTGTGTGTGKGTETERSLDSRDARLDGARSLVATGAVPSEPRATAGVGTGSRARRRGWDAAFAELPLVALLRELDAARAVATGESLIAVGFRIVVVSARAPGALDSIERLAGALGGRACIGVCDVARPNSVDTALDAGATVVVASGTQETIARRCRKRGADWVPGVATVSEAHAALALGARALSLYPAVLVGPRVVHALYRALPPGTPLLPAGGLKPDSLLPFAAAGAAGAVADAALHRAGPSPAAVGDVARAFVETWQRIERGRRLAAASARPGRSP